jgi:TonB family protein
MKSLASLALIALALSFCNLLGKRSNTNANVNAPSGTATESNTNGNSNSPELVEAPPPPESVKPQHANSNAGVAQIETGPPPPRPSPKVPRAPISGGVLNGKAIRLVQPTYPPIARAAHASGQVTVQVLVDENGNVISATAVSGHPLLQPAAVAAARASKFTPTKLASQPVKVTGVLIFNFVAQ